MMNLKTFVYVVCCISFSVIIGAAIYEHIAVWPNAYAAPPKSLSMFQGDYALDSSPFWMSIHPVTLILFIVALFLNWKTERKKGILIPLAMYIVVLATTFIFFVPELLRITGTTYSETVDPALEKSADTWVVLSLIRLAFLLVAAVILLSGLVRTDAKKVS